MSKEVGKHTALFSHLLLHPNPGGDNLCSNSFTAWAVMHIVHILKYLRVAFKFIMSSYCQ